jgi:hypothetical protein
VDDDGVDTTDMNAINAIEEDVLTFGTDADDVVTGSEGADYILGMDGNDVINAGAGNDIVRGMGGSDILDGGEGTDFVSYLDSTEGVNVNLTSGEASGGDAEGDIVRNFEDLQGSHSDDVLTGTSGNNALWGLKGDDILIGGAGNDTLVGEEGNDTVLFSGNMSDYSITPFDRTDDLIELRVNDIRDGSPDGANRVIAVENIQFADGLYSVETGEFQEGVILEGLDYEGLMSGLNDAPLTGSITTTEDTALTINPSDLLANDVDVDGDTLVITSVQDAQNGTVVLNEDGTITFTPETNYEGPATFTYTVGDLDADGNVQTTDTATVTLNVTSDGMSLAPTSDLVSDTGNANVEGSTTDDITSETTPTITGTTENGATVTVTYMDAQGVAHTETTIADADGNYTFTLSYELPEGDNSLIITANDGINPAQTTTQTVVVDTTTSASVELEDSSDADNVINMLESENLTVSGEVEAGGTLDSVVIEDVNGDTVTVDVSSVVIAEDGTYSIDGVDVSGLADGTLTVTTTSTDVAGNSTSANSTMEMHTEVGIEINDTFEGDDVVNNAESTSVTVSGTTNGIQEGQEVSITITDNEGTPVTATAIVGSNGEWSVDVDTSSLADGAVSVTASASDIYGNIANDGAGFTQDTVAEVEDDTTTINEDGTVTVNVLGNDEAGSVITSVETPTNDAGEPLGEVSIVDGQIVFTPAANFDELNAGESADVTFTYTVQDSAGNSAEAEATVTVTGENNDLTYVSEAAAYQNVIGYYELDENGMPSGEAVIVIDDQNGMTSGTHLADMDPDIDYGFFILANGANEVNADSVVTFDNSGDTPVMLIDGEAASHPVYHDTPEFNTDGKDHFVFEADGNGGTNINIEDLPDLGDADFGDVVINVNFEMADKIGNDTTARNDSASIDEDQSITINVVANDQDATGDALTVTAVESPVMLNGVEVGTAEIVDNQIVFTPNDELDKLSEGDQETLTFTYTVSDGQEGLDTARVTLNVTGTNDAPVIQVASAEDLVMDEDSDSNIIGNVSDIDGTIDSSNLSAQSGTVEIDAEGNIVYTPDVNFSGSDTISVSVTDNNGGTTTQTITVEVTGDGMVLAPTSDLDTTSDSGVSDTDNITSDTTPTITGTTEAGATVTITNGVDDAGNPIVVGSAIADADGNYSITTSELGDGEHTLTITADDGLNTSTTTETITVDTSADADANLGVTVATDDEVTNDLEDGHVSTTVNGVDSDAVSVEVTFTDGTTSVTVEAVQDDAGNWSVPDADISTLNDGEVSVTTTVKDVAGNVITSSADTLDHDTSADNMDDSQITVEVAADDEVTNASEAGHVSTDLSGIDADAVGVQVTFTDATGKTVTVDAVQDETTGAWSVPDTNISGLTDGNINVTATVTDDAGNTETSQIDTIDLDTTAGNVDDLSVTVTPGDTAGSVNSAIDGVDADAVNVEVTFSDGVHDDIVVNATQDADGNWTVSETDISSLDAENVTVMTTIEDDAGNKVSTSPDSLPLAVDDTTLEVTENNFVVDGGEVPDAVRDDSGTGNDQTVGSGGNWMGDVTTGDGNDLIQASSQRGITGDINSGAGDDVIISNDWINGNIDAGAGNDYIQANGQNGGINGTIDGGDGYDVVDLGERNQSLQDATSHMTNVEKVVLRGTEYFKQADGSWSQEDNSDEYLGGGSSATDNFVSGNVLDNDVVNDGVTVNEVTYTAGDETGTATVGEATVTAYGELVVNEDGSFTFTPASNLDNTDGDLNFSFSYNVIDADGDISQNMAIQNITIHDGADVTIGETESTTIDEASLAAGSEVDADGVSVSGTLNVTTGSDTVDVTFTDTQTTDATYDNTGMEASEPEPSVTVSINVGTELHTPASGGSTTYTANGDKNFNNDGYSDTTTIEHQYWTETNVDAGSDTTVEYKNTNDSSFDMKSGDDTVTISSNANNASFNMGEGDDTVYIAGNAQNVSIETDEPSWNMMAQSGDDTVVIDGQMKDASINTGGGDDFVQLGDVANATIDLGSGDDVLKLAGNQSDYGIVQENNGEIKVVTGNFEVKTSGDSSWIEGGDWTTVKGAEAIVFEDGTYIGDATVAQSYLSTNTATPESYDTDVTITADGDTTAVVDGIPTGATVTDSAGNTLTVTDNSVSVDVSRGDTTLTISSDSSLDLSGVTVSTDTEAPAEEFTALTQPDTNTLLYDVSGQEGETVELTIENSMLNSTADQNAVGVYFQDANGNPISGTFIFEDSTANSSTTNGGYGMGNMYQHGQTSSSDTLGTQTVSVVVPAGAVKLGFFMAPDMSTVPTDGQEVTFQHINDESWDDWTAVDGNGNVILSGGYENAYIFSNSERNSDNTTHFEKQSDGSWNINDNRDSDMDFGIKITSIGVTTTQVEVDNTQDTQDDIVDTADMDGVATLTHNGTPITYEISEDGHTLTGVAGDVEVFTVEITDPTNVGEGTGYTFTLLESIDHKDGDVSLDELELPFNIVATDSDGDSVTSSFSVTVVDDVPVASDLHTMSEDGVLTFNVSADVVDSVAFDSLENGVATYDATTGEITYTPNEDFSGVETFTYTTTDADGDSITATITVDVKPVVETDTETMNATVTGNEDSWIDLGLENPTVNDADSETITEVRIEGVPEGAELQYSNGTSITVTNGVAVVEQDKVDTLQIKAPEDSNEDFTLTTRVEVTDSATLSDGEEVATQIFTGSVNITVSGVADETTMDAQNADATEAGQDANLFSVSSLVNSVTFGDELDGSETHTITFDGLPAGTVVVGSDYTIDNGSLTIDASDLSSVQLQFTNTDEDDYNITVTSKAIDDDNENSVEIASETVTLHVDASAGEVEFTTDGASGVEDTAIALNIDVTNANPDSDESEVITDVKIEGIPVGASIQDADGNTLFTATDDNTTFIASQSTDEDGNSFFGNIDDFMSNMSNMINNIMNIGSSSDTSTETNFITANDIEGLKILPPEDDSSSFDLTVSIESSDGSDVSYSEPQTLSVSVDADIDSTMTVENVTGLEDTAINLGANFTQLDDSEAGSVVITGAPVGTTFTYGEGENTVSITVSSEDQKITLDAADAESLSLTAPANFSGNIDLSMTTTIVDTQGETSAVESTTTDFTVSVTGDADAPILSVSGASGNEDEAIDLNIGAGLRDTDGSETLTVTVDGMPEGASLNAGTDNGDGTWTLNASDLNGLQVTPPENSNEDFELTITATSTEADGDVATTTLTLPVTVSGVADAADVSASASGLEDTHIALDLSATNMDSDSEELSYMIQNVPNDVTLYKVDEDGNAITIDGGEYAKVGEFGGFSDDGGTNWIISEEDLDAIMMIPPHDFSGTINMNFAVTSIENDGDMNTVTVPLNVEVNPDLDTNLGNESVSGTEDNWIDLELSNVGNDGEVISDVRIEGVPDGATLGVQDGDGFTILTADAQGGYDLSADQIDAGVSILPAQDSDVDFNLSLTRTVTDSTDDGSDLASDSSTVTSTMHVNVVGDADSLVSISDESNDTAVTVENTTPERVEDIEDVTNTQANDGDATYSFDNMNSALYTNNDGVDVVEVDGNSSTIMTYGGDDVVNVDGYQNSAIDLGEGNNTINLDHSSGAVYMGEGDDTIRVGESMNNGIDMNGGDNTIDVTGNSQNIYADGGDDTVFVGGNANGNIDLGAGNDYVEIGGDSKYMDLDEGDDFVVVGGNVNDYIYGGEDNDSIVLEGYDQSMWDSNYGGVQDKIVDFENIKLGDGTVVQGDASAFETSTVESSNDVESDTSLDSVISNVVHTDTDGSESQYFVIQNVEGADNTSWTVSGEGVINAGNGTYVVTDPATATITVTDSSAGDGSVNLQVTPFVVEREGDILEDTANVQTFTVNYTVGGDAPVVDTPTLDITVNDVDGTEDTAVSDDLLEVSSDGDVAYVIQDVDNGTISGNDLYSGNDGSACNTDGLFRLPDGSFVTTDMDSVTVHPTEDFSGEVVLDVTVVATGVNGAETISTQEISVDIAAVTDAFKIESDASGAEDTAIDLDIMLTQFDNDGSESIVDGTVTLSIMEASQDENDNTVYTPSTTSGTLSGDGVVDNGDGTYTVEADKVDDVHFTAPADSHGTFNIQIDFQAQDGDAEIVDQSKMFTVQVESAVDDITLSASDNTLEAIEGDASINLGLTSTLSDADGSEVGYLQISGVPDGCTLSAGFGTVQEDGSSTWTVPQSVAGDVALVPGEHFSSDTFTLNVEAKVYDLDSKTMNVADNSESINITVDPVASEVTVQDSTAVGSEDSAINLNLNIAMEDTDGSETLNITLDNLPQGATITLGDDSYSVDASGTVTLEGITLEDTQNIMFQAPEHTDGTYNVGVSVESVDTAGNVTDVLETAVEANVIVDVNAVASDFADADSFGVTIGEHTATEDGLSITATVDGIAINDTDGSETLTVEITGLGATANIEGATFEDGVWSVEVPADASSADITITATNADDLEGNITFSAVATEVSTGESHTISQTVDVADFVNDAVITDTDNEGVSVNVDGETVSLGIDVPTVTDGSKLAAIDMELPNGVTLEHADGTQIGTGSVSIVIVDADGNVDTSIHADDQSTDGMITMTADEFESLQVDAQDATINVTYEAYEVDGSNNIIDGVDPVVETQTITLDATAVDMNNDGDTTDLGDIQTAVLVDGVVEGCEYETSSGITGITDADGNFSFREGDSVTFSVGGVVLGTATAEDIAEGHTFLQDIADVDRGDLNDEYLENMATFLQSIDSDLDSDNIVISEQMRDALSDADIDLRTATEQEVQDLVESVGGTYVDEEDAMEHVQDMLEEYTDMTSEDFDAHVSDDVQTATFGTGAPVGVTFVTSSGIESEIGEDGQFVYEEGDTISFFDIDGNMIATIDSSDIGSDNLISFGEVLAIGETQMELSEEEEQNIDETTEDVEEPVEVGNNNLANNAGLHVFAAQAAADMVEDSNNAQSVAGDDQEFNGTQYGHQNMHQEQEQQPEAQEEVKENNDAEVVVTETAQEVESEITELELMDSSEASSESADEFENVDIDINDFDFDEMDFADIAQTQVVDADTKIDSVLMDFEQAMQNVDGSEDVEEVAEEIVLTQDDVNVDTTDEFDLLGDEIELDFDAIENFESMDSEEFGGMNDADIEISEVMNVEEEHDFDPEVFSSGDEPSALDSNMPTQESVSSEDTDPGFVDTSSNGLEEIQTILDSTPQIDQN